MSAGLFTYPVLHGGRHPALPDRHRPGRRSTSGSTSSSPATSPSASTRATARRSRSRAASIPRRGAKIMDLQEPEKKMSTTGGTEQGTVYILDSPDEIRRKFKAAVTDSGREIVHTPDKPGISNLIEIMTVVDRRVDRRRSRPLRRAGLRGVQGGRRRGRDRAPRAVPEALPRAPRRSGELRRMLALGRREGAESASRRSRRCTTAWASCGSRGRRPPSARRPRPLVSSRHSPGSRPSRSSPA